MNYPSGDFKSLPAVDKLLCNKEVTKLILSFGKDTTIYAIRESISFFREKLKKGGSAPTEDEILIKINEFISTLTCPNFKKVINATGIIINTNLGRSPFSKEMLLESFQKLEGYNNLEFNLKTGERGSRNSHPEKILKFLTGAEDILVVNNAAAAVMLCLNTFAKRKEVLVSRGELVEIGGSFRIPEVMAASGCKMIEVGTTNKTKVSDYRNAITDKTRLLFKAHKSNFVIKGFTEEVSIQELAVIGKEFDLPVIYDQGCGLLKRISHPAFKDEANVKDALLNGADIVCFSGDKLLGGPQAGIIAGKKIYIEKLKKNQLLRALRVCKTTLALIETTCSYYLNEKDLFSKNLLFKLISKKPDEIKLSAIKMVEMLKRHKIIAEAVQNTVQIGGGSLTDKEIQSYAVKLIPPEVSKKTKTKFVEELHHKLMNRHIPIIGILKKGDLLFDLLTVNDNDIEEVVNAVSDTYKILNNYEVE
ncbi:MAG TPA: L-seryl-tRNA(Sec) selenium transferase [Bacteroidales bacterium]|nr:L-seryl-tRNA(Sec) selenium transferase [Bacteroidales bacterium]